MIRNGVHPSKIMVSSSGVVSVRAVDVARSQAARKQIEALQRIRLQPKQMTPNAKLSGVRSTSAVANCSAEAEKE